MTMRRLAMCGVAAAMLRVTVAAAVTPAAGYAVRHIPTPGTVQGGVVRVGNAILVGQGTFGTGTESIVRLDGLRATTVATGFNSLGGLDVDASGTVYATDNCIDGDFGCDGATVGDTVYGVTNALTRTTAATAAASALLPSGAIPFAQDVLVVPGAVLVTDGVGPGAGRVVKVVGNASTDLVTGLDYAGGLAVSGSTLLVGNSNYPNPATIKKYSLAGASLGTLVSGLSGVYGIGLEEDGNALVTGGSAPDFSGSVVAVTPGGAVSERARGFGFSTDLYYDLERETALVLDFGVQEIAALCRDANVDGLCDGDCAAPVGFDRVRAKLGGLLTPVGDDTFKLSAQFTTGFPFAPALDPVANGLTVWVDDANAKVVLDVVLPDGAYDPETRIGWRANAAGTSWKFKHPTGVVGITSASVKALGGTPGAIKVKVAGKKAGYAAATATLPLRVGVALSPTQCGAQLVACAGAGTKTLACQ